MSAKSSYFGHCSRRSSNSAPNRLFKSPRGAPSSSGRLHGKYIKIFRLIIADAQATALRLKSHIAFYSCHPSKRGEEICGQIGLPAPPQASHSGLLEPRGTNTVRNAPGVRDKTTWSVKP